MPLADVEYEKFTIQQANFVGPQQPGIVSLSGFEIPSNLPLGGTQRAIVTEFIGPNKREVHLLGSQPRELAWEGHFFYDSALDRAKYLDSFRLNGDLLVITWGDYRFKAIIDQFYYNVLSRFDIEYQIRLQVVEQDFEVYNFTVRESSDTVERGILDIIEKIQDVLSIITRAIAIVDAIRRGDVNSLIGALANIMGILGTVSGSGLINISQDSIFALTPEQISKLILFTNSAAIVARDLAYKLEQFVSGVDTGDVRLDGSGTTNPTAEAIELSSSFLLLSQLISRISTAAPSNAIATVNTNVYRVALEQYGDLGAWESIVETNKLDTVYVSGTKVLQLPPYKGKPPRNVPPNETYDRNLIAITAAETKNGANR
jgi:hypothetical protein